MVDTFPFVIFFKDNKIYRYEGTLDLNSFLDFLSADNYKDSKVQIHDLKDFTESTLGTHSIFHKIIRLFYDFIEWSEKKAKAWAKSLGLSHWSDNSKLICFSLTVLGFPSVIITYFLGVILVAVLNLYNSKFAIKKKHQRRIH